MSVDRDIEEAINKLLKAYGKVAQQVGDRVFPNRLPQHEIAPCVITRRVGGGPSRTLAGTSGVKRGQFAVAGWSKVSQEEARSIDLACQEAVENFQRGRYSGWFIQALMVDEESDQDDPNLPVHADDIGLFASVFQVTVFYEG